MRLDELQEIGWTALMSLLARCVRTILPRSRVE
jgi:hypothetical protein